MYIKLKIIFSVSLLATLFYGYNFNPPNGKTGAPFDRLCTECHQGTNTKYSGGNYDIFLHAIEQNVAEFRIFQRFYKAVVSHGEKGLRFVAMEGLTFEIKRPDELAESEEDPLLNASGGAGSLFAPMPGKVIKVNVKAGDKVTRGTVLLVVEAMKMENNIVALEDGLVEKVNVKEGDRVDTDLQLVHLAAAEQNS